MKQSDRRIGQPESDGNDQVSLPLNSALSAPWDFLCPTKELHTNIADTAKLFLDSLAYSVSDSQTTRQRNQRKRKRTEDDQDATSVLRLKQLYVDGFTSDQVWEQALRIFDSANQEIERDYSLWVETVQQPAGMAQKGSKESSHTFIQDEDSENSELAHDSGDVTDQSSVDDEQPGSESFSEAGDFSQDDMGSNDDEEHNLDDCSISEKSDGNGNEQETYTEDRFGLNDGFFSIDDFNRQTELFEQQDARGDLGDESDEEEIDWHNDPLGAGAIKIPSKQTASIGGKLADAEDVDDSDEEEGPTFDNMDFQDESDLENDDTHAAALGGASWSRPLPKTQPNMSISDNDIDRAMANVHRDLFQDEPSGEDSDNPMDTPDDRRGQHSTHEKQRARIADEIRRLEAANVAKKEWMLSGEARAIERPVNSLIEEHLDFERIGKPVPVVTTEISEGIEELIKRRIISKEFDEVIRRRPGLPDQQNTKKARVELEDSKPQQSLAELYETDHLQANDPNYVDPKNQKLLKEHAEISNLWKEISSQLDTLSNWHYKPRAPQASINVVTDVATITMEDAQPTTSGAVRETATLAPQEIYAPGDATRAAGELVMRNGVPITKDEMSREEKTKLRRQKKQSKAGTEAFKQQSRKASEKQQIVSDLKKGGVRLIGKEGEVTDINGSKIVGASNRNGAHAMKL
ncbi:hypothetical protein ARAM_003081 [Aspergillus rambellii]|uniref:U3 small nucleolar ribonucleoprotein protein MPP10 n=1 Tax=Aspergillus rambellii TaxID=308745 RepID=A0A0F8WFE0_9EURO|nr:hypothetical protein ARAM_003081 [Aspergillus rambellii]